MLPMGFALDNLILVLITPLGITIAFSSIIFFGYSIIESITKDARVIYLFLQRRHGYSKGIHSKVEFMPMLEE